MDQKELSNLIYRYQTGTATPEEIKRLETFWRDAHQHPDFTNDHTVEEVEQIGIHMFEKITSAIQPPTRKIHKQLWASPVVYRAAAVLLVLISVSLWFYSNSNSMTEIRTNFGERMAVALPDKSSVVLNGNSVLRYAGKWDDDTPREVWIEGEGFFSVTHKQNDQKFIVHANRLNVEVLGTKFNVRARKCISEVMLTEGQVKLGLAKNSDAAAVYLKPGELATMNNERLSKRTVRKEQFTSWVQNKLLFDRTPLKDIAQMLKETYGLIVEFEDPELGNRELSGEISSATEDDILYAITQTFNLRHNREGRSVIISEQ